MHGSTLWFHSFLPNAENGCVSKIPAAAPDWCSRIFLIRGLQHMAPLSAIGKDGTGSIIACILGHCSKFLPNCQGPKKIFHFPGFPLLKSSILRVLSPIPKNTAAPFQDSGAAVYCLFFFLLQSNTATRMITKITTARTIPAV